jgi:hypothetical protein
MAGINDSDAPEQEFNRIQFLESRNIVSHCQRLIRPVVGFRNGMWNPKKGNGDD